MSPKWMEKEKKWILKHKEKLSRAFMEKPRQIHLRQAIPDKGVIIIMGDRRKGKTGLACQIMDLKHRTANLPGAVCYPEKLVKLRNLLPSWVTVVTSLKDLPAKSVCLVDEASQVAHARRTQTQDALDLESLVALSEQKDQLILFITHHSRKFDINDVHGSNLIVWKKPSYADTIWEREELQKFVLRAREIFDQEKSVSKQLRLCYAMNLRDFNFYTFTNGLPDWWSHDLSTVFKYFENGYHNKAKRKKAKAKKGAK